MRHKGFTLMEVLVATAVTGLAVAGGFRLMAMSYRLLAEIEIERELTAAGNEMWLKFRLDDKMPMGGHDDKKGYAWKSDNVTVNVDDFELKFRKITVTLDDNGRSVSFFLNE